MSITNGYATLSDVKSALRISDSIDDSLIEIAIESASREIDGYCERVFYSTAATRVYIPRDPFVCDIDDLVSVTTIKTSTTGQTFDVTWAATDYQLEPVNGVSGGLVQPYTRFRAVGNYTLPVWDSVTLQANEATVQVAGVFGWSAIPVAVKQACIILAMRQFKRYDSPLGVAGFSDLGVIRVGRVDPDVEALLSPYRKVKFA